MTARIEDEWMQLNDGSKFYFLDPGRNRINVHHIAGPLSKLCRYSGHTKKFYSVAEHSIHLALALPKEFKLTGLFHDGTEAFMNDIPRPIKNFLPQYKTLEDSLHPFIAEQFGLIYPFPDIVKEYDHRILANEAEAVLHPCVENWTAGINPLPNVKIGCWLPETAEKIFVDLYYELVADLGQKVFKGYS